METNYKQDITINGRNYVAHITVDTLFAEQHERKQDDYKFKFLVIGEDNEYKEIITESSKKIELLQNSLRHKLSMSYVGTFNEEGNLTITLSHMLLDETVSYTLKMQPRDISINTIHERRLKVVEKKVMKNEYLVTNDMMGTCYKVDFKMSQEKLRKVFNARKYIPYNVDKYYNLSYAYQKTIPIPTKNQLVVPGKLGRNDDEVLCHEFVENTNIYTILSKKYCDEVVAVITKEDENITFEMIHPGNCKDEDESEDTNPIIICDFNICPMLKIVSCKGSTVKKSKDKVKDKADKDKKDEQNKIKVSPTKPTRIFTTEETYFRYCYLAELPLHIDDGLYYATSETINSTGYTSYSNFFVLIKDDKIYHNIEKAHNDEYTICNLPSSFTFRVK